MEEVSPPLARIFHTVVLLTTLSSQITLCQDESTVDDKMSVFLSSFHWFVLQWPFHGGTPRMDT